MATVSSTAIDIDYPARLNIDYPDRLGRLTTFLRLVLVIPILVILYLLAAGAGALLTAIVLMILFRRKYPKWWFEFARELIRFNTRVLAYLALLTDRYPSTDEQQSVRLDLDHPDATRDLNRWLPLVKWLIAIPHYVVLLFLMIGASLAVLIAWFAIILTGRYPRGLFDYVVGVARWTLRVEAYAFLMTTDRYPPFSLR